MPRKHSQPISRSAILAAALLVAVGGLIYELLLGTASSYLFGDSITSFSLSIGTMLFGMGIGSLVSARLLQRAGERFVLTELALSVLGGNAAVVLFAAYTHTRLYWLIFVLLSTIIGILIGFEIPLMVRIAKGSRQKDVEHLLSRVLALDYIGALLASLLFPFVLLPYLGLVRTSYAMGLFNALIAYFILRRLDGQTPKRLIKVASVIVIVLFSCGLAWSQRIERVINTSQYTDPVVYYRLTPYQKIAVTAYGRDVRLYLNDQLQFSSLDEARYHETFAHASLTSAGNIRDVLILGGGDGLLAREALKYKAVRRVTIVDIDPAMTAAARTVRPLRELNQNALHDRRVQIINQDAFTYVRNATQPYDVILADLVDPSNERIAKLYSQEFYTAINRLLAPGGVFTTQATSTYFTPNAFRLIEQTMHSAMPHRRIIPMSLNVPSFGEWGFLVSVEDRASLLARRMPPAGLRYVSPRTLQQAQRLPPDYQPAIKPELRSTLLNPIIYRIYQQDMGQWRYD